VHRVGLVTVWADWPFARQVSAEPGAPLSLHVGESEDVDFLVVFDGVEEEVVTDVPEGRLIQICTEPPEVFLYRSPYLSQFDRVVTVDGSISHPGKVLSQPGLNWFYGVDTSHDPPRATLGSLAAIEQDTAHKEHLVSAVISSKCMTRGHFERLQLIKELKRQLGDRMHLFGAGHRPIPDKRDAIEPYKFHLALENSILDHYWTEKLADAYLGRSFPLYRGAPNIGEYFPTGSYLPIPVRGSAESVARLVVDALNHLEDRDLRAPLERARQILIRQHNLFALIARICDDIIEQERGLTPPRSRRTIRVAASQRESSVQRRVRNRLILARRRYWAMRSSIANRRGEGLGPIPGD